MSRIFLGLDIQEQGLTFAALRRGKPANALQGLRFESLEGAMEFSSRQPNVRDARRFVEAVRRGADLLAAREERLSLSLPDRVGRIFLTEAEGPFKSHQEGLDVLKWRLKSSLPLPPAQMHLDYQVLDRREGSRQRCLVAAISLPVLEQYQDLINEAGRYALYIDFHSLNLYNYYRPRLDLGSEFILVSLEQSLLALHCFQSGLLVYQRSHKIKERPEQIFREINRTLVEVYESFPAARRCAVFAHVDPVLEDATAELLSSVFERDVQRLDSGLKRLATGAVGGGLQGTGAVVAALGGAERLMRT